MSAPALEALRTSQLRSVGTSFLRLRPWVVGPALPCVLVALFLGGAPHVQIWALGGVFSLVVAFFAYEAWRGRRVELGERWLFRSLFATLVALAYACAITGGIRSPLLPLVFAPVVTVFAAFGRGHASNQTFGAALALAAGLTALPPGWPWPIFPSGPDRIVSLGALAVALILLRRSVSGLTDAHRRAGEELDRMRREALAATSERMKSLELLAGKLAHELRNPLSSVKALSQLLARTPSDQRAAERLDVVVSEIARMEAVLTEYLSFSRPLDEIAPAEVDLADVANDAIALLEARAAEAGVTLTRRGPSLKLLADGRKLRDALVNLITNALQATPRGGAISVATRREPTRVSLEVFDTGVGIPEPVLSRLGTPFFTTREGGSGLGLAVARGIAEQHGGKLEITSEPGRGTCAALRLPLSGAEGRRPGG